jgi:dihydroneopterin aldolase
MNAPENDSIAVTGLGLVCRIGVPEEERAVPQRLEADLVLWPCRDFRDLGDSLAGTVDYGAVALQCREVAVSQDRQLIETLAGDLAAALLAGDRAEIHSARLRKCLGHRAAGGLCLTHSA